MSSNDTTRSTRDKTKNAHEYEASRAGSPSRTHRGASPRKRSSKSKLPSIEIGHLLAQRPHDNDSSVATDDRQTGGIDDGDDTLDRHAKKPKIAVYRRDCDSSVANGDTDQARTRTGDGAVELQELTEKPVGGGGSKVMDLEYHPVAKQSNTTEEEEEDCIPVDQGPVESTDMGFVAMDGDYDHEYGTAITNSIPCHVCLRASISQKRSVPLQEPVTWSAPANNTDKAFVIVPDFAKLMNFSHCVGKNNRNGKKRCVMCGHLRSVLRIVGQKLAVPIIPYDHKGVCTDCQVRVWKVVETNLEIKFCQQCKKFIEWSAFCNNGMTCNYCQNNNKCSEQPRPPRKIARQLMESSPAAPTLLQGIGEHKEMARALPESENAQVVQDSRIATSDTGMTPRCVPWKGPVPFSTLKHVENVMCGHSRLAVKKRSEATAGVPFIPYNNNGVCTACEQPVWKVVESDVAIKWCRRCRNFRRI